MKRKKKQTNEEFLSWWDKNFFYTDQFYQTYKKLHAAGADLDYIKFICMVFIHVAEFNPVVHRKTLRQAKKRIKKGLVKSGIADVLKRQMERLYSVIPCGSPMIIFGELRAASDLLYSAGLSASKHKVFVDHIQSLIEEHTTIRDQKLLEDIRNLIEEDRATEDQKILAPALALMFIIKDALDRVCLRINVFRRPERGQQPDPLGTFVLLAVSEHLREKHAIRPHYRLAAEFLRKLTGDSKPTALSARVRVHDLKRSHRGWEELLSFVKEQEQYIQNAVKPFLPIEQD